MKILFMNLFRLVKHIVNIALVLLTNGLIPNILQSMISEALTDFDFFRERLNISEF